jgi:hypothetical protein
MILKLKELIKSFLKNVLGIQLVRVRKIPPEKQKPALKMKYVHDPASSYMIDPIYQDMLLDELSLVAESFKQLNILPINIDTSTRTIIEDFFNIYTYRSKTDNTHGSGFHNAFWIYYITRLLDPMLIVESGVWKGHTSWLLHKACPNAALYGFDISLNKFEFPELRSSMFQQDWKTYTFPEMDPDRALVFFDCHVNHAQRILEAKEKGFKHLLFDDNPPIHKIFTHIPGIPTAAMLAEGQGIDSSSISWVWNNEKVTRPIDPEQAQRARELIKTHEILPDVGGLTRYGGFAFLTYVQI